ncbi:MAG TPA: class I SAM-dependent methyltransferase [Candidatus Didemnitutus sp.]|nr:class I SAM-dependent methyltransferase [Candidatus Didemnitutus sp.]
MYAVNFRHEGREHTVPAGASFSRSYEQGFRDTAAADLQDLVAALEKGKSWREAVDERYAASKPWLHRIIVDPARVGFVGPVLSPAGGAVLDIGAGWGQLSRAIARSRPVVALEPVAERLDFIGAAARQDDVLDRIVRLGLDYFDLEFTDRFAAICAIGVLEWAGAFQDREDARQHQFHFLQKARRELAPGGELILGIENRTGLKYLLGCPDDHLGVAGVACLPAEVALSRWRAQTGNELKSFTYSSGELERLLRDAGFSEIEFFGAFPDYKLPASIIPFGKNGGELNTWLGTAEFPREHNGFDGSALSDDFLEQLFGHYRSLGAAGIGHHFVPSFFVRAR